MNIISEHCSLVLNRNTLETHGSYFTGQFVPANPATIKWLEHFDKYIERVGSCYAVEFGPSSKVNHNFKDALEKHLITNEKLIGLILADVVKNEDGYFIKFMVIGPFADATRKRLLGDDPFIISAKTLVEGLSNGDDIINTVTEVCGLQLLDKTELKNYLPKETVKLCSIEREALPYKTLTIDPEQYMEFNITKNNIDIERAIHLNLAAGNHIDYNAPVVKASDIEANIKRQVGIDFNECFELLEAYVLGDVSLMRDALADKRVTLNGFQSILPFSLIGDYRHAIDMNFTRFDDNYERALETQEKYKALGVETEITCVKIDSVPRNTSDYFVNRVAKDCTGNNGEIYTKGKWVKSKYFTDSEFDSDCLFTEYDDPRDVADAMLQRHKDMINLIDRLKQKLTEEVDKKIKAL